MLDLDSYRLERAGQAVPLEPKALNLLALVVQRPGHVFTKQELFETLWPNTAVTDHALTRVVSQIRRGLGDEAREARYLETVPTRGYRWIRPLLPEAGAAVAAVLPTPGTVVPVAPAAPAPATPGCGRPSRPGSPRSWLLAALQRLGAGRPASDESRGAGGRPAPRRAERALAGAAHHPSRPRHVPGALATGRRAGVRLRPRGRFELYVRDLAASGADLPLTRDGGHNVQPAWSPDGRQIAYHSSRHGGVWVMPARGGPARQLAASGSHPAWSPDGRRVAFQSDEFTDVTPSAFGAQSGSTLWVVNADGSGLRALTTEGRPMGGHGLPAWTRDGRRLAFMVFDGGASNGIWLLDLDTGATRLLEAGTRLYEFTFAPDGSAIYAAGGPAARILRLPFDAARGVTTGPRRESFRCPACPACAGSRLPPTARRWRSRACRSAARSGRSPSPAPATARARRGRSPSTRAGATRSPRSRRTARASPTCRRAKARRRACG